ncbi:hypothetical protein D3C81_1246300 [compost metagenome]
MIARTDFEAKPRRMTEQLQQIAGHPQFLIGSQLQIRVGQLRCRQPRAGQYRTGRQAFFDAELHQQ